MADNNTGYNGQQAPGIGAGEWGAVAEIARRIMLEIQTTKPVQVVAVRSAGELAEAGFIDVQPLVNQVDGAGNQVPHGVIHNVPYIRMQGGANAVIMDPVVGDIGICGFCTHDISVVKSTKKAANPGSKRRFDYADAVYIGGILNGVPTQFIRFYSGGIEVVSPTKVRLAAPVIELAATDHISNTAPQVSTTASTSITETTASYSLSASSAADVTAPTTTIHGAEVVTGLTSLNGGFAALARAGGGASTINSAVSINGNTDTTGTLTNNGHAVGSTHAHGGVQPGTGTSGTPT